MAQTNLDGTNYQTQTGANSKNFIGGDHRHYAESSEVKRTAKKILMLSANPKNTKFSIRKKEITTVENALGRATLARMNKHSAIFESPLDGLNIKASDLSQQLSTIQPSIICISGNENGIESLMLGDKFNESKTGNLERLKLIADFYNLYSKTIDCIILNGCYSEEQAREIAQHIEFVIGVNRNLKHTKVIEFLNEFFYHLNLEDSIQIAYRISRNCLERLDSEAPDLLPVLLKKYDVIKQKNLEEELNDLNKKIENDENSVELWKKKASLLKELGRAEEANEAYEKAASLDPNNYKIRTAQGDALEKFGKHEKAVKVYSLALELEKEDYKVWWKKGQALVEVEKYDEAIESYSAALELEPPSPDSYIICREYACLLAELEQHQESIALYKKSLSFEPNYRVSSFEKKQLYKKMYSRKG